MKLSPVICPIYGSLAIHWYGLCVMLGVIMAILVMHISKANRNFIIQNKIMDIIPLTIVGGFLGGKIMYLISEVSGPIDWTQVLQFWQAGLSMLGCMLVAFMTLFFSTRFFKISLLGVTDFLTTYAPIVQGFGRLGCFFTGCCFGKSSSSFLAITYEHAWHAAPLHVPLYPIQLQSALTQFIIFGILYYLANYKHFKPGIITCLYFILVSFERFLIDFFRADQVFFDNDLKIIRLLSINQWTALAMMSIALMCLILFHRFNKNKKYGFI